MITQREITSMTVDLINEYEDMEDELLVMIAGNFNVDEEVEESNVNEWFFAKMMFANLLSRRIRDVIRSKASNIYREISTIITEGGYRALVLDEKIYRQAYVQGLLTSPPPELRDSFRLKFVINEEIQSVVDTFNNINNTVLRTARGDYYKIINKAYSDVASSLTDYQTSIRQAVRALADKGITGVEYTTDAGRQIRYQVDTAVRRDILTRTSQAAGKLQLERANEWGSDYVEVSSHVGARPEHALFQGMVYHLEGGVPGYPDFYSATGYGTITGLKGVNCYHDFYPFFPGISQQAYEPYALQENYDTYEQSQQQRALERDIREQKRRVLTADAIGDTAGKAKAQTKLKEKESQLKTFLSDTGRTARTNRQQVEGFGRDQAMAAIKAASK